MSQKTGRTLSVKLEEDDRHCAYCNQSLAHRDDMLYIVIAGMKRAFEFCSWRCLLRWVTRLLYHKALDVKLDKSNLLSRLGFTRRWGARAGLERPKRRRNREEDGPAS